MASLPRARPHLQKTAGTREGEEQCAPLHLREPLAVRGRWQSTLLQKLSAFTKD